MMNFYKRLSKVAKACDKSSKYDFAEFSLKKKYKDLAYDKTSILYYIVF